MWWALLDGRTTSFDAQSLTFGPAFRLGTSILVGSGEIPLPASGRDAVTVSVPNVVAFPHYLLVFEYLRGPDESKLHIAEIVFERSPAKWGDPAIVKTQGGAAELSAVGIPSIPYTFYRSFDLTPGSWVPLGTAGGAALQLTDPAPPVSRAFYRIEEQGVSVSE